ncbi:ferritin-like domain-containing protein [Parafilimonas sp.]|uniref:ferritin-like domain-containing protein n=1 Tax=Parafilimonas sp. TaxID=1969739 RepID=UPI0039E5A994
MKSIKPKIVWRKPKKRKVIKRVLESKVAMMENADLSITQQGIIYEPWIPYVRNAKNPKEELLFLLKMAAEIEHALLIQYLYSAYSILDKDEKLRNVIIKVSIQEMGHFLSVQNLLISIGGLDAIHLHKDLVRPNSVRNPLPFRLEPISKTTLAKYVAVEAPPLIPSDLKEKMEEIEKIAFSAAGVRINPVGGLYMKLFWLFQKDDSPDPLMPITPSDEFEVGNHIKDEDFLNPETLIKLTGNRKDWNDAQALNQNSVIFNSITNRDSAKDIISKISTQGEGADFKTLDSHFEDFFSAYENYDSMLIAKTYTNPINPVTIKNPEFGDNFNLITNQYSLLWAGLLNKIYTSLLYDIYSIYFLKSVDATKSHAITNLVFSSMRGVIPLISAICFKLPLNGSDFSYDIEPRSGPTFEIDKDFLLPNSIADLKVKQINYMSNINEQTANIRNHSFIDTHKEKDENVFTVLSLIDDYVSQKSQVFN